MKKIISLVLICIMILSLASCALFGNSTDEKELKEVENNATDLGDDDTSFGTAIDELHLYDGKFEGTKSAVDVQCIYGDLDAYKFENGVLKFSNITQDTVYQLSGNLYGNIEIEISNEYKFDLELHGVSIISKNTSPISIRGGNKVSITAKKGYKNYIYDEREYISSSTENNHASAIYSNSDLEVCGKGNLVVVSENNNGIHSTKDLQVKNLDLTVYCIENSLKGNDSLTMSYAKATLISTKGDGIKTTNSDVSSKNKQRGNVIFEGGTYNIYSAHDGISASHNVEFTDPNAVINIYTDKYSNYSKLESTIGGNVYYIRYPNNRYKFSIKYLNDNGDSLWVEPTFYSQASTQSGAYYYAFEKNENFKKFQVFIYSLEMPSMQDGEYLACSEVLELSNTFNTFALNIEGDKLTYNWTNIGNDSEETKKDIPEDGMQMPEPPQNGEGVKLEPPQMGDNNGLGPDGGGQNTTPPNGNPGLESGGNTNVREYSAKGIKAVNDIIMNGGKITVKSYDDSLHTQPIQVMENGQNSSGNITINTGSLTLYSNDDAIGASGNILTTGGVIYVCHGFEGMEGNNVTISSGNIVLRTLDDGINSTAKSGEGIVFNGGETYIYAGGDGIDANSRDDGAGIVFNDGKVVVISTSVGNAAIDTECNYTYKGGKVVAIMPKTGMIGELKECYNFDSIGKYEEKSLRTNNILAVEKNGNTIVEIKIPTNIDASIVYLENNDVTFEIKSDATLDGADVRWKR